jgi:hypothetical protein
MRSWILSLSLLVLLACSVAGYVLLKEPADRSKEFEVLETSAFQPQPSQPRHRQPYKARKNFDTSGSAALYKGLKPSKDPTSLEQLREAALSLGPRKIAEADAYLSRRFLPEGEMFRDKFQALVFKASMLMYEGQTNQAYQVLQEARSLAESAPSQAHEWLYSVIFFQGVAGLRRGEDENCLQCRGEGACIFPLRPTAIHSNLAGSRLAIQHFTEYLEQFPNDLGVRWLLNLAYMTLGEYPSHVPPRYLLTFDKFGTEADIGRFQDIAHLVGVRRLNEAGGAIMDDFDNDGFLDLVLTSSDPAQSMAFYRNKGDGTFEDRTETAGLSKQYGGLNCVQTDYNNDGFLDIFIPRGAWYQYPMRPTLLRNDGNGTFTDVTQQAGLMDPVNSNCATWADFDNDGFLDLYICNETGPNRLYRNRGDGTFEEVAGRAGVRGKGKWCKGATWIDYDNDGYPDLFLSYMDSMPQLFHNNRDGTFTDTTAAMGITGPKDGFSCWAFDYDNDGWLDIFATCYQRDLEHLVGDMLDIAVQPHMEGTRLYRNLGGKKFQDVSKETGVNKVFSTMGSNFADFDNDGYLDFYLATGEPSFGTLVPNRMFKNIAGQRFADITATSGTGHLQKGHGVACGDWDRDGNVDLFVETGGAVPGDRYHSVLFQNPGQGNHWLTVKLVGQKSNRAAIGARIKVVTDGGKLTVHRHISHGSSFGANPLQQTIGLGQAARVGTLEIYWPTSQTTQVFHDVVVNQAIEVTEFAKDYRKLNWNRLPLPKE